MPIILRLSSKPHRLNSFIILFETKELIPYAIKDNPVK
jgi:hypothetical protein